MFVIPPKPEPQVWDAIVNVVGLNVYKYPVVTGAALTGFKVNSWDVFSGRLWSGNNYTWMLIDESARPEIVNCWVAVCKESGEKFVSVVKKEI